MTVIRDRDMPATLPRETRIVIAVLLGIDAGLALLLMVLR